MFFDPVFAPLVEHLAPKLPLVRGWVVLCEPKAMPAIKGLAPLCYEELMATASPDYEWPLFDENTASSSWWARAVRRRRARRSRSSASCSA